MNKKERQATPEYDKGYNHGFEDGYYCSIDYNDKEQIEDVTPDELYNEGYKDGYEDGYNEGITEREEI